MKEEKILILDFGSQYVQLIARRVRELNVYCEIVSHKISAEEIKKHDPKGLIFSGGPDTVYNEGAISLDPEIFNLNIPILGICYGMQLMGQLLGGKVERSNKREYGKATVKVSSKGKLFENMSDETQCWMSHYDYVSVAPTGFEVLGYNEDCPVEAIEDNEKQLYGVQFHPEVEHTLEGKTIFHNFLYNICKVKGTWKMDDVAITMIEDLKKKIGDKKVLLGLSGGVDSSVAAVLLHKAVGKQLTCIFLDHGLLRQDEGDSVEEIFTKTYPTNFIRVNCEDRFLSKLEGISDPESKRKIIGEEFIRVFEEEAQKIGKVDFLAQGTIYPDVVESGVGQAEVIKSHHNVGGLPDHIDFEDIVEPLRDLFKDEVRQVGIELGIPKDLVFRQPFPGPGLAIRVIGEITKDKLEILRHADKIFRDGIKEEGLDKNINQYFAVLTNLRSVGVMGDGRTYDYTLALRAVTTIDFMTATWSKIPLDTLEKISNKITNEVKHINRVVYDITSKPPATIEWE